MTYFQKKEVYVCPNLVFEEDRKRAAAWYLVDFTKSQGAEISFSSALKIVEGRVAITGILALVDDV